MTADRSFIVDRLHGRVRVATVVVWLGCWVALMVIGVGLSALLFGSQPILFWLPWSLATLWFSQYPSRWAEARLAERWPSGRTLHLSAAALTLNNAGQPVEINRQLPFQRSTWCFKIQRQRGSRVPAGHFCLAARWGQDQNEIVVYAFASQAESAALRADNGFYELLSARDRSAAAGPTTRGRDEAYLAAENARYERGGELSLADFEEVVRTVAPVSG